MKSCKQTLCSKQVQETCTTNAILIISKCAYVVIDFYSTHALLIFEIKMNVTPSGQSLARNCEFKMFLFVFV